MENLTKEGFNSAIGKIIIAFNYNTSKEQMELYYQTINSFFSDEEFNQVCDKILMNERFFPTISVFMKNRVLSLSKKAF